jgi:hypothetical protein
MLRDANPKIKVILTVSPVPLTATASGDHVLIATMRSKSILRAVAADAVSSSDFVDYFPSFEIVSSFPYGRIFYEANLRSVKPDGVAHVMNLFFDELARKSGAPPPQPRAARSREEQYLDDADEVCEELMLEQYAR